VEGASANYCTHENVWNEVKKELDAVIVVYKKMLAFARGMMDVKKNTLYIHSCETLYE